MNNSPDSAPNVNTSDLDYDLDELRRFRAFMSQALNNSTHPDDRIAAIHLYGQYCRAEEEMQDSQPELHESDEEVYHQEGPDLQASCRAVVGKDDVFEGSFLLPGEAEARTLVGHLIGFDSNDYSALVVLVVDRRNDSGIQDYFPFFFSPVSLLPKTLLDKQESFKNALLKSESLESNFEFTHDTVNKDGIQCTILLTGLDKYHYCDERMAYSFHNGLFFLDKSHSQKYYYMITDKPIWFEDSRDETSMKIYQLDTKMSSHKGFCVLESSRERSQLKLAQKIARAKKFQMCTRLRTLKEVNACVISMNETCSPDEGDKCLQYILTGGDVFKDIGILSRCKGGFLACSCDVQCCDATNYKVSVKKAMKQNKARCKRDSIK